MRAPRVLLWIVSFHAAACARHGPAVVHGGTGHPVQGEVDASRIDDAGDATRDSHFVTRYLCGESLPAAYAFVPSGATEHLTDRVVLTPPLGLRIERVVMGVRVTCEVELSDCPIGNIWHIGDIRSRLTQPAFLALLTPGDAVYGDVGHGAATTFTLEHARGRVVIGRPCAPSATGCRPIPVVLDGVRHVLESVYGLNRNMCTLSPTTPR